MVFIDTTPLKHEESEMYEFHGWAVVKEASSEASENGPKLDCIIENVRRRLDQMSAVSDGNPFAVLRAVNGQFHLIVTGYLNRRGPRFDMVRDLFNQIAAEAPGSYGIIYIHDDEDLDGHQNEFRVWVLARGKFDPRADHHLSPLVPTISDE